MKIIKKVLLRKSGKNTKNFYFILIRPMNHTEQTTYNSATGSLKVYCQAKASLTDCEHYKIISYDGKYDTNIKYKFNDTVDGVWMIQEEKIVTFA